MPSIDDDKHNTCVLFKSNSVPVTDTTSPATTESPKKTTATTSSNTPTPKKLPDTGPVQYVLLFILSLLITFGLWMFARFSKNRITVKK
jgi:LPXTG-motif cell wall-anchored protein